jgi:REP element-mobilizing transposase RayT
MRRHRIKIDGTGVYHCIARTVAGEFLLDDTAKEVLRQMLWKIAAFSGVEILTYSVLSNHFHVLARVIPVSEQVGLDRAEVLRRYRAFYGERAPMGYPSPDVLEAIFAQEGEDARMWESRLKARMGDISEFMKTLKQRFTVWFNVTRGRFGTLWAERFTSILVENSAFALKTVAAYIDLNPVRAGLVADPGEYRWCSYFDALNGNAGALQGLEAVMDETGSAQRVIEAYRMVLFGKGAIRRRETDGVVDFETAMRVLERGGRLDLSALVHFRVRHLSRGVLLGSPDFVTEWAERLKSVPARSSPKACQYCELPVETLESEASLVSLGRRRKTTRDGQMARCV